MLVGLKQPDGQPTVLAPTRTWEEVSVDFPEAATLWDCMWRSLGGDSPQVELRVVATSLIETYGNRVLIASPQDTSLYWPPVPYWAFGKNGWIECTR